MMIDIKNCGVRVADFSNDNTKKDKQGKEGIKLHLPRARDIWETRLVN